MRRFRRIVATLVFSAALLLGGLSARAADPSFPALTGRVVDNAGILSANTRDRITTMLAQEEQRSGNQIVVATIKSLQGNAIETYGYRLGRAWGIGQKDKNNGAILIVAPAERKVRIEVGYGLEGQLTDAQSRVIIENAILPAFKRGDYDAGVLAGTAAILDVLGGNASAAPATPAVPRVVSNAPSFSGLVIFIIFLAIWLMVWRAGSRRGYHGVYFGGFGGGGFSGGGGGGGFSGGGGSFGGGGASGGW